MMMKYYGESIYKGIGIGKILFYSNVDYEITKEEDDNVFDVSSEIERFESAKASLLENLMIPIKGPRAGWCRYG